MSVRSLAVRVAAIGTVALLVWSTAAAQEAAETLELGEVELTDPVRTLSIRVRARDGRNLFRFDRLILEEIPTATEEIR